MRGSTPIYCKPRTWRAGHWAWWKRPHSCEFSISNSNSQVGTFSFWYTNVMYWLTNWCKHLNEQNEYVLCIVIYPLLRTMQMCLNELICFLYFGLVAFFLTVYSGYLFMCLPGLFMPSSVLPCLWKYICLNGRQGFYFTIRTIKQRDVLNLGVEDMF